MGKITLQDSEVGKMVKSLLGSEPLVTELDEFFTIHAFYTEEHTPEYLCAVIDAVAGRFGKRFIKVEDDTSVKALVFKINYNDEELLQIFGNLKKRNEDLPESGDIYCHKLEEVRAIQVRKNDHLALFSFVGGGEMTIKTDGTTIFTFLNNGVYIDVMEFDYIVKRPNKSAFEIWSKAEFEKQYEHK